MHAQAAANALPMSGTPETRALVAGQLIRQATGGDVDAFEEVVRRLQRRVYGFAYQHLRDLDEAYDLTQEIFVKLYRNLARYDAERPFEPWFWSWPPTPRSTTGASASRCPPTRQVTRRPRARHHRRSPTIPCSWTRWPSSTRPTACPSFSTITRTSRSNRSLGV